MTRPERAWPPRCSRCSRCSHCSHCSRYSRSWACADPPIRDEEPALPGASESGVRVRALRSWYLTGDGATPAHDPMTLPVDARRGTYFVDARIADLLAVRLASSPPARSGSSSRSPASWWERTPVLLAADGATTAFARIELRRSATYYVLVTTDWDFSDPGQDPGQNAIGYQSTLHADHPELRITHFVGPYTFTDPQLAPARQAELVAGCSASAITSANRSASTSTRTATSSRAQV